ncbi:MAG: GIY-YIG nuclease family protein [Bacteroidales bacterium]
MYYLYIIYSESSDKYYVGISSDPERRLEEHNTSDRKSYTRKHRPWSIVALFECAECLSEAMKIERFIKKQKKAAHKDGFNTFKTRIKLLSVLYQLW